MPGACRNVSRIAPRRRCRGRLELALLGQIKVPLRDRPGTKTVRVNSRPIEDLDWIAWTSYRAWLKDYEEEIYRQNLGVGGFLERLNIYHHRPHSGSPDRKRASRRL